ncbi:hypothetical protein AB0J01_28130 [Streptomyces sp. NPDC050204]|uniref:hypothetical protein n=1 Tax=Streptomyces sp. NPDC050204 TaxID=3155514 RepID=UPI00342A1AB6
MDNRREGAGHPAGSGPDYSDLSNTAVAYRWVPRDQGQERGSQERITHELADGLAAYADRQGVRLTGDMSMDFPEFRALPKDVRRDLLRTMWRQEPWWRFGSLVLVRAWQQTSPKTAADADRPAP